MQMKFVLQGGEMWFTILNIGIGGNQYIKII